MKYLVTWQIDSDAATPLDAAGEAWAAMRRTDSIANVFDVVHTDTGAQDRVDLSQEAFGHKVVRRTRGNERGSIPATLLAFVFVMAILGGMVAGICDSLGVK